MHAHSQHSHTHPDRPQTTGRTINWAWGYDTLTQLLTLGREQRLRQATLACAQLQPGETVLDVGCGTGSLTLLAAKAVGPAGHVFGIDASPAMIALAQRKAAQQGAAVDLRVGVIEALAFPDATFDVVLSSLMFHHLPGDLKRRGLADIYRVLKPGGRLLVVDLQQPKGWTSQLQLVVMLHGGLGRGVEELAPLMRAIGYVDVESGDLKFGPLGYIRGRRDTLSRAR